MDQSVQIWQADKLSDKKLPKREAEPLDHHFTLGTHKPLCITDEAMHYKVLVEDFNKKPSCRRDSLPYCLTVDYSMQTRQSNSNGKSKPLYQFEVSSSSSFGDIYAAMVDMTLNDR